MEGCRPERIALLRCGDTSMALVLGLALGHHADGGVVAKIQEPGGVEIIATARCHDHVRIAIDDGASKHALALLTRLSSCGVQLDGGHTSGLPAPLTKGDGKACFVQGVHGLQDEITGHSHTVLLFGMSAEDST